MYPSKHDAFLGALKVGMHQALLVVGQAYDTHKDDWPQGVAAGLRALLHYLASEPAHSHLILVDTFAASPEATATREESLHAFASYLQPGYQYAAKERLVPGIAPEAIAGGIWQVLHHYAGDERTGELPILAPQLIYAALTPFLGAKDAAKVAQQ
jgi:AcrR family transcriptional regulator